MGSPCTRSTLWSSLFPGIACNVRHRQIGGACRLEHLAVSAGSITGLTKRHALKDFLPRLTIDNVVSYAAHEPPTATECREHTHMFIRE